jgi:hypothetical protein
MCKPKKERGIGSCGGKIGCVGAVPFHRWALIVPRISNPKRQTTDLRALDIGFVL